MHIAKNKVFVLSAVVAAIVVIVVAWLTGLREVAHDALLSLLVFAFFPILIVAAAIGFLVCFFVVAGLFGGEMDADVVGDLGEGVGEGGFWLARVYYRFFASRKHPVFWGTIAGFTLGILLLWLFIGIFVFPKEMKTAALLTRGQAAIETHYKSKGGYPRPVDARLNMSSLPGNKLPTNESGDVIDSFGQVLDYQVRGRWKLASYRLRSVGFDGSPSRDDLCVVGRTKLKAGLDAARDIWALAKRLTTDAAVEEKLGAIHEMDCD